MVARIVIKFALFIALIAGLVKAGGLAFGLGVGMAVASFAWMYGSFRLLALHRWVAAGSRGRVPIGRGLWDDVFALLYREQRAQRRQLAELADSLNRFRKAAQALPDGVITLTRDNHILFCNAVAVGMFNLDAKADVGHAITNLVRLPEFAAYLNSENWSRPITVRLVRQELRMLQLQLIEVGDGQRLLLSRDVTQLERLETMRRDFVANVSHELKTPLTVLAGFLETMHDHEDMPDDQKRRFLDLMNEQALRMRRIVEDLLALSALEATPYAPRDTAVMLDPLLARLENGARSLSRGRHTIAIDAPKGLALYGAETELVSAFENLVSNAVRYTPDGGRVYVRIECDDQGLRFSVRDTGIGIEAHHLPRLTERFYRVDRSRSRDSGGTGLGLAIVKHVLTRHNGSLRIDSEYGRGTTMTAIFPPQRVARSIAAIQESAQSNENDT
ncbi:MAG TPA: phosphate regulon sensor histidine kinase PhoR [Burkholderiaceae bacterium]|nr:phosphate regulon sensor histidine kinase PhoR [Burkholderiaceae bacterium]